MIGLKKFIMNSLIGFAVTLMCFILAVCLAYINVSGIEFNLNGTDIRFNGLTYENIKQFDIKPNSLFIVIDGEEQLDITNCECEDSDQIKSVTAVVTSTNSICDFSVFGIHTGDSGEVVFTNMPKESSHTESEDTGVRISRYVDKDNNVLIVGTDTELNIVSYITVRIRG